MITQTELQELLQSTETYRVERITSSGGTQDDTQDGTQVINHSSLIINH